MCAGAPTHRGLRTASDAGRVSTAVLSPDRPEIVLGEPPAQSAGFVPFFDLGVEHLVFGFDHLLFLYTSWWARILEVFLLFGLMFHALNGARIIVQDFSPRLWRYERQLIWAVAAILVPIMIVGGYAFLRPLWAGP
jgi:hypothetical protein